MNATVEDVEAAFVILRAAVPGRNPELDTTTVGIWHLALARLTGQAVILAATEWVQEHRDFPSLSEFLAATQAAGRKLIRADVANRVPATERCAECDGGGWVEVSSVGQTTVRPCQRCNPAGYARWKGGHFMAGHDCEECRGRRGGKAP